MSADNTEIDRGKLQYERVYPKLMYVKPKSGVQKILLLFSWFYYSVFFLAYELTVQKLRLVVICWCVFAFLAALSVDSIRRAKIFPENKLRYNSLLALYISGLILLLSYSIYWLISWELKSFPVLEMVF